MRERYRPKEATGVGEGSTYGNKIKASLFGIQRASREEEDIKRELRCCYNHCVNLGVAT